MSVKKWDQSLRPREKALNHGIESCSDSELLALLLRNGLKGQSVLELSYNILNKVGGLKGLYKLTLRQLTNLDGIGLAKACEIMAAFEIVKRIKYQDVLKKDVINHPQKLVEWLKKYMGKQDVEYFVVIFLDNKNRIINYKTISIGSNNVVNVDVSEVFSDALAHKASKMMIAHNHPSQSISPSLADDHTTAELIKAGKLLNIPIIDHLIISYDDYYSYKEAHLSKYTIRQ